MKGLNIMIKPLGVFLGLVALMAAPAAAQDSFGDAPKQQPQQQTQPAPQTQPKNAQPAPNNDANSADPERRDYGVAPTNQLHSGAMHAATPASIPGGQLITTKGLAELMQGGQTPFLLLDILGGEEVIPGAVSAVPASQPGSFNDQTQAEFAGFLQQMTGGNKETPVIVYCLSDHCWMSYNAALRAINIGYTNVLWYRGGIEAWKAAGYQTQSVYMQGGQPY